MDTGLEYEGEAARKRFAVYWLRPAVAALAFGLFTFLVVSIPGEKEKIQLREELVRLRAENRGLQDQVRGLLAFSRVGRSEALTVVELGRPGNGDGRGRVLYDDDSGRGVVWVSGLDAGDRRAFCWWSAPGAGRRPLAAIDLDRGAGEAQIQLGNERGGSFLITLEALEGEPREDGKAVLEGAPD